jgi:hypothetical protein
MEDEQPINRGGRPPKLTPDEATLKQIGGLGRIQVTTKEGAAWFSVSEPTFLKFLADNPEARTAFDDGKQVGLTSLRRTQFRLAEKNAAMAIFLGKNYLGQSDKLDHQHTGANGGPIQTFDLSKLPEADLDKLESLLQRAAGGADGVEEDAAS